MLGMDEASTSAVMTAFKFMPKVEDISESVCGKTKGKYTVLALCKNPEPISRNTSSNSSGIFAVAVRICSYTMGKMSKTPMTGGRIFEPSQIYSRMASAATGVARMAAASGLITACRAENLPAVTPSITPNTKPIIYPMTERKSVADSEV